jgi:hypothetical protein
VQKSLANSETNDEITWVGWRVILGSASYLRVSDERRGWEPVLRTQDWDLGLGIQLEVCGDFQATVSANTCRNYVGIGRAVDNDDAANALPWLLRNRSIPTRPLIFLLATPDLTPWFPLWWEAGAEWIATEKHQIKTLVQLVARTSRYRPTARTEQLPWHEIEVGQLPWHDET